MTGTDGNVFNVLHNPSLGQVNLGGGTGSPLHKEDSPPRTVVLFYLEGLMTWRTLNFCINTEALKF